MNNTAYHHADVQIDPRLPQPGMKDIAKEFGVSAHQMDENYGVRIVDEGQGVYRVGVTSAGANQIERGPAAIHAKINRQDFYLG